MTIIRGPQDFLATSKTVESAATNVVVTAWTMRWPAAVFPVVLSARVPLAVASATQRGASPEQVVDAAVAVPAFADTYSRAVRALTGGVPPGEESADAAMDALIAHATGTPLEVVLDELRARAATGRTGELANTPNAEELLATLLGATPVDPGDAL